MGFYIRKSLSVGPLRFNLSKSGIGVSAGIRGLRFGTGPRGNYVHMGRGGFYFRKTLAPGKSSATPKPRQEVPRPASDRGLAEALQEIESGSVLNMTDSSAAELLEELHSKRKLARLFPFSATLSVILFVFLAWSGAPPWALSLVALASISLSSFAYFKDKLRKTVVIFYELEPEVEAAYQKLHDAFDTLRASSRVWHIEAAGAVKDVKYHAGASTLVKRKAITFSKGNVPYLKTNIETPTIPVGKQLLAFMPERLLVFDSGAVGAVPYSNTTLSKLEIS